MRRILCLAVILLLVAGSVCAAATPTVMGYQGRLTDNVGDPVVDGTHSIVFTIYDDLLAGSSKWTETINVTTTDGFFDVLLGTINPLTDTVFSEYFRYLGISVDGDPELTNRTTLVSVPFAYRVSTVDGASGGRILSKVAIGPFCSNIGTDAFVAGDNNAASGDRASIGGGSGNSITIDGEYAVIAGGRSNTVSSVYSAILGGEDNVASGLFATVGAGESNISQGLKATVAGGGQNLASGDSSTVSGGVKNTASGNSAAVSGGQTNTASGSGSLVGGGFGNLASGYVSTVGGGSADSAFGLASVIGGGFSNLADGDYAVISGGENNSIIDGREFSTIGGGRNNLISESEATVGGGGNNVASGQTSTISGGADNEATRYSSTVPGGVNNSANGGYSFAAGRRAKANHVGAFVWGDSTDSDVTSSAINEFTARTSGGARFYSDSALTTGVALAAGGGAWAAISDRNVKENFRSVDGNEILDKISQLDISRWNYITQDESVEHIGPMAQDFYELFGVGDNNTTITTIDPDGISLAAIKALIEKNKSLEASNGELRDRLEKLEKLISALAK